jgi:hypothetical protein
MRERIFRRIDYALRRVRSAARMQRKYARYPR